MEAWSVWEKTYTLYRKSFLDRCDHLEKAFISESRKEKNSKMMMTIKPMLIFNTKSRRYFDLYQCQPMFGQMRKY